MIATRSHAAGRSSPVALLFLIALALQVLLPVALVQAMAATSPRNGDICFADARGGEVDRDAPDRHHGNVCAVCQMSAGAELALLPAPVAAPPPVHRAELREAPWPAAAPPAGRAWLRPPICGPPLVG